MQGKLMIFGVVIFTSLVIVGCPSLNLESPAGKLTVTPTTQVSPTSTTVTISNTATSQQAVSEVRITAKGVGIAPSSESDPARRERAAIRAAELDADRNFAQWQAGLQLDSVTVSKESMLEEDTIRETVKATMQILRNTVEQHYDNTTGTAQITVEYVVNIAK